MRGDAAGPARARPGPACTGRGRPGRTARRRPAPRSAGRARPGRRRPRRRPRPSGRAGRGGSCGSSRCRRPPAPADRRGSRPTWARSPRRGRGRAGDGDGEPEGAAPPGSLSTPISPPIAAQAAARWRARARCRRSGGWWRSRPARRSRRSGARPRRPRRCRCRTPRSGPTLVRSRRATRRHATTTSPASVNFTALPARLSSTWRMRAGSPRSAGGQIRRAVGEELEVLGAGRLADDLGDALDERDEVEVDAPRGRVRPDSIFEKSRIWLMTPSSACPAPRTPSAY